MEVGMNEVFVTGRVSRDPRTYQAVTGSTVVKFHLMTSESWKRRDGTQGSVSHYIGVTYWTKHPDEALDVIRNGAAVFVQGSVVNESWEDKDKVRHYETRIKAKVVLPIPERRGEYQGVPAPAPVPATPKEEPVGAGLPAGDEGSSDLPF